MRPHIARRFTVQGVAGIYVCPNVAATDARMRSLLRMLPLVTAEAQARIRIDLDKLLDHRLELMAERGNR